MCLLFRIFLFVGSARIRAHTRAVAPLVPCAVVVHFSVHPTQLVAVFVQYRYLRHWLVLMSSLFTLSDVAHSVVARFFSP